MIDKINKNNWKVDLKLLITPIWSTIAFFIILSLINLIRDFDDMTSNLSKRLLGILIWSVLWFIVSFVWSLYKSKKSHTKDRIL